MAIITISRGSYSKGKEIAEKVAEKLGYECVSRDILLEASEGFNIPEVKLVRALHDAPSVLNRFTYGRERFIGFFAEAFLEHVHRDNVVYHGLAGHFFLKGVPHNLKVRIISDLDDRIREEMNRENISEAEARKIIVKDDAERRKWSMSLYGIDTADPCLYDLVIHIHKLNVDNAVDLICDAVNLPNFKTTPESQQAIEGLLLASKVKVAVQKGWPGVQVVARGGKVYISTDAPLAQEAKAREVIIAAARKVPGVEDVEVSITPAVGNDY